MEDGGNEEKENRAYFGSRDHPYSAKFCSGHGKEDGDIMGKGGMRGIWV